MVRQQQRGEKENPRLEKKRQKAFPRRKNGGTGNNGITPPEDVPTKSGGKGQLT